MRKGAEGSGENPSNPSNPSNATEPTKLGDFLEYTPESALEDLDYADVKYPATSPSQMPKIMAYFKLS